MQLDCGTEDKLISLTKIIVMGLAISNKTLDKYFRFLRRLDNSSKKRLIIKLTESMETDVKNPNNLKKMFGAWEDTKDSDEIITQIRNSRINNREIEQF
jgi:hypothetical protein